MISLPSPAQPDEDDEEEDDDLLCQNGTANKPIHQPPYLLVLVLGVIVGGLLAMLLGWKL